MTAEFYTRSSSIIPMHGVLFSCQTLLFPLIYLFLRTPSQGATTAVFCAVSEEVEGVSGRHFRDCRETPVSLPASLDSQAAQRLWDISSNMTGLNCDDSNQVHRDDID